MGPSRKRARTKPPSVEESAGAVVAADSTTTKPSTPGAEKHSDVVNKEEDAPTPLKAVKPESSSSKQVSLLLRQVSHYARLTLGEGEIKE
jgi:hypothetical protein